MVSHAELAKLSMPVLILWGDEDVFLVPERGSPSVRAIPDVEEVVLHAGHAPWLNKPAESAAAIRAFLGRTTQDLRCQPLVEISCRWSTGFVSIPPSLPETGPVDGDPLMEDSDPELTPSQPAESEPDDRQATSENHHDDSDETPPQ